MYYKDQLQRAIKIVKTPLRIISLVPSQTELLIDLGLKDRIVGITKFCIHPETLRKEKRVVGGTKQVKYNIIDELQPDIILCNKEENTKEIVDTLAKKYPVYVSDVATLTDALELIKNYGELFDIQQNALEIESIIRKEATAFEKYIEKRPKKRVAYFIWRAPWMVTGGDTFINHLLKLNGFENVYAHKDRYPEVTLEEIATQKLDAILLSSEPFPFEEKHVTELKKIIPSVAVLLVDGEYFSWYGSRLTKAFEYFKSLSTD